MMKATAADEDITDWRSQAAGAAGKMLARKGAEALLRQIHQAGYRNPFYETYVASALLCQVILRNATDEEMLRSLVLAHVEALAQQFPRIIQYEPAAPPPGATVS